MSVEAFAQFALMILLVLVISIIVFAIWFFGRRLFARRKRDWHADVSPRPQVQQNQDGYSRIESSLIRSIDSYSQGRAEVERLAGVSQQHAEEARRAYRDLQAKHDQWTRDFGSFEGYKAKIETLLDEAIRNMQGDYDEFRTEQMGHFSSMEARIEPLFQKQVCPWVVTMQETFELSDPESAFLETIAAYIEGIGPDLPKYLSGVEAAASQLGHFVFRAQSNKPVDSSPELLADICDWFANLHQSHEIKIPVVGDGFDERFHKDVSSSPRDKEAVSIVDEVVNWGLLEVGATPRTVFKAEIKCRS